MRVIFCLILAFAFQAAYAVDWMCSNSNKVRSAIATGPQGEQDMELASVNRSPKTKGVAVKNRIDHFDLQQAYSGQTVLLPSRAWLLVVMLPADHPDTISAFAELGLGQGAAKAAERMAADTSLVDRGIRVVQTPMAMIEKVANNPPAVGFGSFFVGGRDVAPCF